MTEIKQSSASRALVFKLVDASDGYTAVTSAMPTVQIRKEGGSFATPAGAVTEIAHGYYQVAGNATDSNTLGTLVLFATATGARPADMAYNVVANLESDTFGRIGAPGAGDIANDIDALAIQVNALQNLSAADVRTELATELARIDVAVSSRSSHSAADVWAVSTRTLSSFGTLVADVVSGVWAAATRTLTAVADSTGVGTLLSRLSAARAGYLDKLNVSGTLAHSDAAATYRADVSNLATAAQVTADGIARRNEILETTAPDNAGIAAIKAITDQLIFQNSRVNANATVDLGDVEVTIPQSVIDAAERINAIPGDGAVIVIPDPSEDPGQCVLYVSTRDIDGVAVPGVRIRVQPRGGPATTAGGQLVGMVGRDMVTDQDGFATMIVERPDLLTPANVVTYEITAARYSLSETITPNAAVFNLASLIS